MVVSCGCGSWLGPDQIASIVANSDEGVSVGPGDILSGASLIAAIAATPAAIAAWKASRKDSGIDKFKEIYAYLGTQQLPLATEVLERSPSAWRNSSIPMLTKDDWIADQPWPLDSIAVEWDPTIGSTQATANAPRVGGGLTYSEAVRKLAGMGHFFNGEIYRPLDVNFSVNPKVMKFGKANYFDFLDTNEVLAFEEASRHVSGARRRHRSYRSRLANPFDFQNRVASLGILTLTARVSTEGVTFVMHRRDPTKVVVGSQLFHVAPAGEFTPSDISLEAVQNDLSIWKNIVREYAEEYLNIADAQGTGGRPIDYHTVEPYRKFEEAKSCGDLKVHVLGLGLDPLSWKPELLTVSVISAPTFDDLFPELISNDEGTLVPGRRFDDEVIQGYLSNPQVRPGAKACLELSWRHRSALGLA